MPCRRRLLDYIIKIFCTSHRLSQQYNIFLLRLNGFALLAAFFFSSFASIKHTHVLLRQNSNNKKKKLSISTLHLSVWTETATEIYNFVKEFFCTTISGIQPFRSFFFFSFFFIVYCIWIFNLNRHRRINTITHWHTRTAEGRAEVMAVWVEQKGNRSHCDVEIIQLLVWRLCITAFETISPTWHWHSPHEIAISYTNTNTNIISMGWPAVINQENTIYYNYLRTNNTSPFAMNTIMFRTLA